MPKSIFFNVQVCVSYTFSPKPAYYLIQICSLTKGIPEFLWNVEVWVFSDFQSLQQYAVSIRPSIRY